MILFSTAGALVISSLRGIHSITHHPVHILVAVLPPALMVFFKFCTQFWSLSLVKFFEKFNF